MGIRLRRSGREDFLILEKAYDVGGTWRENTYPGLCLRHPLGHVLVLVRAEPGLDAALLVPA
jgi:cation diffusion facilitator CzcD-associated flavoprotein CzcO